MQRTNHHEPHDAPVHATSDFAVVNVPGCGFGMRAERDLEAGATILREKPLVVLSGAAFADAFQSNPALRSLHINGAAGEEIIQAFAALEHKKLSDDTQRRWLALADSWTKPPAKTPGGVIRSNAFTDPVSGDNHLYELLSRANHSCAPSMSRIFTGRWHVATVTLLRPVSRHEPLTLSYLGEADLAKSTSERRALLSSRFNFLCECERCGRVAQVVETCHPVSAARRDVRASAAPAVSNSATRGNALSALDAAQSALNDQLHACSVQLTQMPMRMPLNSASTALRSRHLEAVRGCADALRATASTRRALLVLHEQLGSSVRR